ncbi:MAG: hypothetical protein ACR2P0_10980 [Acidimicrobiales bacterium]
MPTAPKTFEMFFFERVPHVGHFGVESSEKDCTFSNSSPQLLQRYWYVGIGVVTLRMRRNGLGKYWAIEYQRQPRSGCST